MKASISSKAFCSITDRQTDKIFTEQMLIYKGNLHKKKLARYLNQGPRKSHFPLNLTHGQTYGQTDISIYRVASLLKMIRQYLQFDSISWYKTRQLGKASVGTVHCVTPRRQAEYTGYFYNIKIELLQHFFYHMRCWNCCITALKSYTGYSTNLYAI